MSVKEIRVLLVLAILMATSACSKTFVVVSEVPRPLVVATPIAAQLQFTDEFREYEYLETDRKRALEKVSFGEAQVDLFTRIFGALFELVSGENEHSDLKIEPKLLDFQYSIPSETKTTQFEIWLKYRLRITDGQGDEVADWVVKGYGKTPSTLLGSHLKLFNTAANIALRDVGAQLAIGFRTQPSIKEFLQSNGVGQAPISENTDDGKRSTQLSLAVDNDPQAIKQNASEGVVE